MGKEEKMIIGIDPGSASGGIAILSEEKVEVFKMPETEKDIFQIFEAKCFDGPVVFLEIVHSMPKQGISSAFKFGKNFGFLLGVVTALRYPLHMVSPQKWQKALGCLSHGDKNITKIKAQQLFPNVKVIHAVADALLIAEYGRRSLK
jgi:Holliday junction resolvasome RuvABC endonuclease subunit